MAPATSWPVRTSTSTARPDSVPKSTPMVYLRLLIVFSVDGIRLDDDFEAGAGLGQRKGGGSLFERQPVGDQRQQVHPAARGQPDGARIGVLHSAREFDGEAFGARGAGWAGGARTSGA